MMRSIKDKRSGQAGFTLVELLVVIVILGILAGIVVFAVGGVTDKGQTNACKADKASISTAEEAYFAQQEVGAYATMAELKDEGFVHEASTYHDVTPDNAAVPKTYAIVSLGTCP